MYFTIDMAVAHRLKINSPDAVPPKVFITSKLMDTDPNFLLHYKALQIQKATWIV